MLVYDKVLMSNVKIWLELKLSKVGVLLNIVYYWFLICVIWFVYVFILCYFWEFGIILRKYFCLILLFFFLVVYVECYCGEYIIFGDRYKFVWFVL